MKKIILVPVALFIVLIIIFSLSLLVSKDDNIKDYDNVTVVNGSQKYITGTIYEITEGRILVAEGLSDDPSLPSPDHFIGNAGWFTITENTKTDDLYVGARVDVWVSGSVLESYPVQAAADAILFVVNSDSGKENGSLINIRREREETPTSPVEEDPATPSVGCYKGGCSGEVCSEQMDVITTCEMIPGMECLNKGASCQLVSGSCGWVLSEESAACFLRIKEEYGEETTSSRIGHLFQLAENYFR